MTSCTLLLRIIVIVNFLNIIQVKEVSWMEKYSVKMCGWRTNMTKVVKEAYELLRFEKC